MTGCTDVCYLIGVDGGGTATRVRLTRPHGEVLGSAESGPSALGQGIEQAWTNVSEAIEAAFRAADIARWTPDECAIGLGLSGAIVIAGTGSIGEAIRANGTHVSIGGWGFPIGDEASGAWLGMQAIREAQKSVDGRAPRAALVAAVEAIAGDTREALLAWGERAGQHAYGSLAPLVFDTESVDHYAAELVSAAARAIDDIAVALDPKGALPLVVSGSIGGRLRPRLAPPVRARLVEPAGDAIDGALYLIRERLRLAKESADAR